MKEDAASVELAFEFGIVEHWNDSLIAQYNGQIVRDISLPLQQDMQQLQGANFCCISTDLLNLLTYTVAKDPDSKTGAQTELTTVTCGK